jgi:hypothetical protein
MGVSSLCPAALSPAISTAIPFSLHIPTPISLSFNFPILPLSGFRIRLDLHLGPESFLLLTLHKRRRTKARNSAPDADPYPNSRFVNYHTYRPFDSTLDYKHSNHITGFPVGSSYHTDLGDLVECKQAPLDLQRINDFVTSDDQIFYSLD